MLKIEITSAVASSNAGVSKKTGEAFNFRKQSGYVYLAEGDGQASKYPTPIQIGLEDGQQPYPVGMYQLAPSSLYVASFGKLQLGRIKLLPLIQSAGVGKSSAAAA